MASARPDSFKGGGHVVTAEVELTVGQKATLLNLPGYGKFSATCLSVPFAEVDFTDGPDNVHLWTQDITGTTPEVTEQDLAPGSGLGFQTGVTAEQTQWTIQRRQLSQPERPPRDGANRRGGQRQRHKQMRLRRSRLRGAVTTCWVWPTLRRDCAEFVPGNGIQVDADHAGAAGSRRSLLSDRWLLLSPLLSSSAGVGVVAAPLDVPVHLLLR